MKNTFKLLEGIPSNVVEAERAHAIANNLFVECMRQSSRSAKSHNQKNDFYRISLSILVEQPFFRWMNAYPEIFED